jgi:hypothetical protein
MEGCARRPQRLRPLGMGEAHALRDAGGGSRVHTYKQLLQPNTGAALRPDLRPVCMRRKRVAEYSLKRRAGSRLGPLQHGLRGV